MPTFPDPRLLGLVAALALALAAVAVAVVVRHDGAVGASSIGDEPRACDLVESADSGPAGDWLTNDLAQWQILDVGGAVDAADIGLYQGFVDDVSERLVYLYDESRISREQAVTFIERALDRAVETRFDGVQQRGQVEQRLVGIVAPRRAPDERLRYDVAALCVRPEVLAGIADEIRGMGPAGPPVAVNVDLARGVVTVSGPRADALDLERFGDLVRIEQDIGELLQGRSVGGHVDGA